MQLPQPLLYYSSVATKAHPCRGCKEEEVHLPPKPNRKMYNLLYNLLSSNSVLQGQKALLNLLWVVSTAAKGKQHLPFANLHSKNSPAFPEKRVSISPTLESSALYGFKTAQIVSCWCMRTLD